MRHHVSLVALGGVPAEIGPDIVAGIAVTVANLGFREGFWPDERLAHEKRNAHGLGLPVLSD
jgi:hypothetical protein